MQGRLEEGSEGYAALGLGQGYGRARNCVKNEKRDQKQMNMW